MGLYQYSLTADDLPLTPADMTPEAALAFNRHCIATEQGMLEAVFAGDPVTSGRRVSHVEDNAFRREVLGSGNNEKDIFDAAFSDQAPVLPPYAGKRAHTD